MPSCADGAGVKRRSRSPCLAVNSHSARTAMRYFNQRSLSGYDDRNRPCTQRGKISFMESIIGWLEQYGLAAVFINVGLEQLGLPVPTQC